MIYAIIIKNYGKGVLIMPTLEWIGKSKVVNHHLDVPYHVLEQKYSFDEHGKSDEKKDSENMIIHGDNLVALKSLLPQYEGRIKCIYIDPPYNTGNENWVYNDNVNDPRIKKWLGEVVGKEGEDLSRHDKWLCMMYPRLQLLRRLLSDEGVIFISIDDNEQIGLRHICNEIFAEKNFVAQIIWQKRTSPDARKRMSNGHEYIVVYAKDSENTEKSLNLIDLDENDAKNYRNPDNDPRGPWVSVDFTAQGYRPNQMYEITTPSGDIIGPPAGRCWKNLQEVYELYRQEGRLWFGSDGSGVPRQKNYLSEKEGKTTWTWWPNNEVGHTQEGTQELALLLGKKLFDYPKPVRLIERIVQLASDKDSIILDSFAGSGTTAHAVLNMNKRDGGNRKFILIEMMDYADSITAERVKRVIDGYGEGKKATPGTGGGFSYYELGVPVFNGDDLNEDIGIDEIRKYVYFTETRQPPGPVYEKEPAYMGTHLDVAYYFNYDKEKVTILNREFLHTVKTKADAYVIYADMCTLSENELDKWHITFKKIPRDISRL